MVANIAEQKTQPEHRGLMAKFAGKFDMEPGKMMTTLKATAFRLNNGEVTNEQMAALIIVADQYGLNPFTKEIYAFPHQGGIVPVVGVDGWSRIVNENKQYDGVEFDQDDEKCTCRIFRKDRSHATEVTEYLAECRKANSPAWGSHPKRMLRHKAFIQCARMAFSYTGIYDEDEAERIIDVTPAEPAAPERPEREAYPQSQFDFNLPAWTKLIEAGTNTAANIIDMIESKATLTDEQKQTLLDMEIIDGEINENA